MWQTRKIESIFKFKVKNTPPPPSHIIYRGKYLEVRVNEHSDVNKLNSQSKPSTAEDTPNHTFTWEDLTTAHL